jgi:hypothetical protein
MVERPGEDARKAEILSIRAGRQARGARPKPGEEVPKPTTEYYVHYVEFNKVCTRLNTKAHQVLATNAE